MSEETDLPATPPSFIDGTTRPAWYIGGLLIGSILIFGGLQHENGRSYVETDRTDSITVSGDPASAVATAAAVPNQGSWRTSIPVDDDLFDSASGSGNTAQEGQTALAEPTQSAAETAPTEILPGVAAETDSAEANKVDDVPATFHLVIQPGDNLDARFNRLGISASELAALLSTPHARKLLTHLYSGEVLVLTVNPDASVESIEYQARDGNTLTINRVGNGFESSLERPTVEPAKSMLAEGTIETSFYASARKAGLGPSARAQVAAMLGSQVDFDRRIRAGDRFKVLYKHQINNRGTVQQKVIAAELTNRGRTYQALRYTTASGRSGNFAANGDSLDVGFLRYPLTFKRISSKFSKRRWHPKLNRVRAHLGVDFAAPIGTPVKAPAAGTVVFVGRKNGYGNVLEIEHGKRYKTVYAHLSRFAPGMRKGKAVDRGTTIAYVGKTGLATGPHLHYEFHKDGKAIDPLKAALPNGPMLAREDSKAFKKFAKEALTALNQQPEDITVATSNDVAATDNRL